MECSSAVKDKAKSMAGETRLCDSPETQVSQQSQEKVGSSATAGPRLSPSKRPRISENDKLGPIKTTGNPRFGRSCKKCSEIRKSLKMEIANLRKDNLKIQKNLREEIFILKRDKENLQNTVNFLQNMFTNFNIKRKM